MKDPAYLLAIVHLNRSKMTLRNIIEIDWK